MYILYRCALYLLFLATFIVLHSLYFQGNLYLYVPTKSPATSPATFCCIYCPHSLSVLHYIYIKFRARYFHYISTPTEILSQDFISEFHLLFQQRFTQIFDEVTHSPQLSVIPGTAIATVSLDN